MKQRKNDSSEGTADGELSLAQLAEESGLTERTIRYYISRGLLEGPSRGGRGAFYTREHVQRLQEIRQSQEQGLTLTEIERKGAPETPLPKPEVWWAYPLADDIVVQVKGGTSPWRQHQVRTTLERLARELSRVEETERKDKES